MRTRTRFGWAACLALATGAAHGAGAQVTATRAPATVDAHVAAPDSEPQRVVQRIDIARQNVFDSAETARWYARLANTIHFTTREHVVARELLVDSGGPVDSVRLAESARNLRALKLFREVNVDTLPAASTAAGPAVRVTTRDAWSTKLSANIGVTGSQTTWSVSAAEGNFLGLGVGLGVKYKEDPDRSTFEVGFKTPRVIADRIGSSFSWRELSDGRSASALVNSPFFSLETREAGELKLDYVDGQVLRFVGGDPEPAERDRRLYALARLGVGRALVASPTGYLRVGGGVQLRREDFAPESAALAMPRTVTGAALAYVEWRRASFIETGLYQGLGLQEDVDVSTTVRVSASLAPQAWGYERTGVGPALSFDTGRRFGRGFALLRADANGLYSSAGLDSGSVSASGTLVVHPAPRQVVTLYLGGARREHPFPGQEYDLGLDRGPRGYPAHAFTGDRAYFAMSEYRWVIAPSVLDLVSVGVAAFAEGGGAWYGGSQSRAGVDTGFGFRLGPTRAASGKAASRIDFVHRSATDVYGAKWVFVFGGAYPFQGLW